MPQLSKGANAPITDEVVTLTVVGAAPGAVDLMAFASAGIFGLCVVASAGTCLAAGVVYAGANYAYDARRYGVGSNRAVRNFGWNLASSFGAYRVASGVGRFYRAVGYAHKYQRTVRFCGRSATVATGYGAINNLGIGVVSYASQANIQARSNRWAHKWD